MASGREPDARTGHREWNASEYHRVANPQYSWGLKVLERVSLGGDEGVLDAGCGSGRLTAELAARVPRGHVMGVDLSADMARRCRDTLFDSRENASCVCADLLALPFPDRTFDLVFSAATFHWVLDHDRLFAELARVLPRGGRLEAQCGGGTNLLQAKRLAKGVARSPVFEGHFVNWSDTWLYPGADESGRRLRDAGFTDVECWLEDAPATFDDVEVFRDFLRAVVLRPWLAHLAPPALRQQFVDAVTDAASRASPSLTLDYQRLNIRATRA